MKFIIKFISTPLPYQKNYDPRIAPAPFLKNLFCTTTATSPIQRKPHIHVKQGEYGLTCIIGDKTSKTVGELTVSHFLQQQFQVVALFSI